MASFRLFQHPTMQPSYSSIKMREKRQQINLLANYSSSFLRETISAFHIKAVSRFGVIFEVISGNYSFEAKMRSFNKTRESAARYRHTLEISKMPAFS